MQHVKARSKRKTIARCRCIACMIVTAIAFALCLYIYAGTFLILFHVVSTTNSSRSSTSSTTIQLISPQQETQINRFNDDDDETTSGASSCITFVGDTMLANLGKDYSASHVSHPRDSFEYIRPLLRTCSNVIANLEGPITKLGLDHDPLNKKAVYSFNMDPHILPYLLVDEGITHVNRANNHLLDRGDIGVEDTTRALKAVGLPCFGFGISKEEAAKPLILTLNSNSNRLIVVGVTGYSEFYSRGVLPDPHANQTGVLPVTSEYAQLGRRLLDDEQEGVDIRIAFVHWGKNYGSVSTEMKKQAAILVDDGKFDIVIGSDGSHTIQEFEYVNGVPVLYNIGNFLFQTPGRFHKEKSVLPYGLVVHLRLDKETGRIASLELHCTHIDNRVVNFRPKICTGEQAAILFSTLGPYIDYIHNNTYATVHFFEGGTNRIIANNF